MKAERHDRALVRDGRRAVGAGIARRRHAGLRALPGFAAASVAAVLATSCVVFPQRPDHPVRGDWEPFSTYVTAYVETMMERHDVVGATVVLVDDQRVVFSRGFGWADRAESVAATPDSAYVVASLTKLFTASAVMQLVEEGKVDLDAPVRTYIPEFRIRSRYPGPADITVRMLMTHHSGLPSDWGAGLFRKKPMSFRSIVDYLKDNYVSYPPNTILNYSNIGVDLLGLVIERVSGIEYREYVESRLFAPLGMTSSWFPPEDGRADRVARSYTAGRPAGDELFPRDEPSTSMCTTGTDLARFAMAMHARGDLDGCRILAESTVESMWVPQNEGVAMDLNRRIGLMWQLGRRKLDYSGRVVFHHGLSLYHRSTLVMLPDHRLTAIVLTNTDTGDRITEGVADEMLRMALEVKEGLRPPRSVVPAPVELPPQQLAAYTGTFATLKGIARITLHGDRLKLTISGVTLEMLPTADGYFNLRYRLLGILPLTIKELEDARATVRTFDSGRVLVLEREGIGAVVGEEIAKPTKVPPPWLARVGRYSLVSPEDDFRLFDDTLDLEVKDGILTGTLSSDKFDIGTLNLILDPQGDQEALIKGLGRSGRETLFVKTVDGQELLEYSGYFFKKDG